MRDVVANENEVLRSDNEKLKLEVERLRKKGSFKSFLVKAFRASVRGVHNMNRAWVALAKVLLALLGISVLIVAVRGCGQFVNHWCEMDLRESAVRISKTKENLRDFWVAVGGSDRFVQTCYDRTETGRWKSVFKSRTCTYFNTVKNYEITVSCEVAGCLIVPKGSQ